MLSRRGDVADKKMGMKKVSIGDVDKEEIIQGEIFLEYKNLGENCKRRFLKMKLLRKRLYRKQIKEEGIYGADFIQCSHQ